MSRSVICNLILRQPCCTANTKAALHADPPGPTVEAIKKRGTLNCGIDTDVPGFAAQDASGTWKGIDIDYCRALAAAVLGDPGKIKYTPTTAAARSTTLGLDQVAVNFYAGQGFLVRK